MKKILLPFLLFAIVFTAQAQDAKPTKEATQKFLNTMLSQVVGNVEDVAQPTIRLIQKQYFDNDFTKYLRENRTGDDMFEREEYLKLGWQDLTDIKVIRTDKIQSMIRLKFNSKMENKHFCCFLDEEKDKTVPISFNYTDQFFIYVPTDKVESCKKAFLRLVEIAKEENKDPFAN